MTSSTPTKPTAHIYALNTLVCTGMAISLWRLDIPLDPLPPALPYLAIVGLNVVGALLSAGALLFAIVDQDPEDQAPCDT